MHAPSDHATRSNELAREQSLIELEQAVADREQLVGDRDQTRINDEQLHRDGTHRHTASLPGHRPNPILDDLHQARIDREQVSRDVGQEALDHAQRERDEQQEALDEARLVFELPFSAPADDTAPADATSEDVVRQGAIDRAVAARGRAEAHLIRAQASLVRAQAAEARARAFAEGNG
jgi:hypothetical protein